MFFGFLVIMILIFKNFDFLEMGAFSWEKIKNSLFFFIGCSLVFASWVTWGGFGDELIETFSKGILRKRKKKKE